MSASDEVCKMAYEGNFPQFKLRLDKDRSLASKVDSSGRCPLHWASSGGRLDIVEYLQRFRVDVDIRDETNWTPMMIAASAGHTQIVKTLIGQGAQVNAVNSNGQSAMHYAASRGRFEIAEILLQNGADAQVSDHLGHTPLHRAASVGNVKMVKLLLQYIVDVNQRDSTGSTPLERQRRDLLTCTVCHYIVICDSHMACEDDFGEIAHLLVDHGARLDIQNNEKKTPLDVASRGLKNSLRSRIDVDG